MILAFVLRRGVGQRLDVVAIAVKQFLHARKKRPGALWAPGLVAATA